MDDFNFNYLYLNAVHQTKIEQHIQSTTQQRQWQWQWQQPHRRMRVWDNEQLACNLFIWCGFEFIVSLHRLNKVIFRGFIRNFRFRTATFFWRHHQCFMEFQPKKKRFTSIWDSHFKDWFNECAKSFGAFFLKRMICQFLKRCFFFAFTEGFFAFFFFISIFFVFVFDFFVRRNKTHTIYWKHQKQNLFVRVKVVIKVAEKGSKGWSVSALFIQSLPTFYTIVYKILCLKRAFIWMNTSIEAENLQCIIVIGIGLFCIFLFLFWFFFSLSVQIILFYNPESLLFYEFETIFHTRCIRLTKRSSFHFIYMCICVSDEMKRKAFLFSGAKNHTVYFFLFFFCLLCTRIAWCIMRERRRKIRRRFVDLLSKLSSATVKHTIWHF